MTAFRGILLAALLAAGSAAPTACATENPPPAATAWGLPGAEPLPADLQRSLDAALAAQGEGYRPRTRHLRENGAPRYANRLLLESSPYLRQHAHNPVNWYPWGEEAFRVAQELGRPVLLSIGYSTCHWCHVMEEESFEDEEIAAYLNAHYVAIKVDREERPDVDSVYMSAVQMMTGRGGWPMTTWLTPAREPFFGGTYFPARDGDRGASKGFLTLLSEMRAVYEQRPDDVVQRAAQIVAGMRTAMTSVPGDAVPGPGLTGRAAQSVESRFDPVHGGLNRAPKFPSTFPVRLMLRHQFRTGDVDALGMATLTLDRMAGGGIHDQVGGGFHRYSTDARWLVPHFEKMLYDNALLAMAYLDGYQVTGREEYRATTEAILAYVRREMTSPGGAFYSATDADSANPEGEREEGWFFTWTSSELRALLDPAQAGLVQRYYGVTEAGNFEGRSILHVQRPLNDVAAELGIEPAVARQRLEAARQAMYRARLKRPAPLRDDKILTAWNGLMISAFARAGFVLDDPGLVEQAGRAAGFVLGEMRDEGRLLRSHSASPGGQEGFLDDYAFFTAALLDLFEAGGELRWLREAAALQAILDQRFQDSENGGYYTTSAEHETLLAREKPDFDGARPSGNSVAAMNLLRLHELTSDDRYRATADRLFGAFGPAITRNPAGFGEMLQALDFRHGQPLQIVIVTRSSHSEAEPFLEVVRGRYLPDRVIVTRTGDGDAEAWARLVPLTKGRVARDGQPTAYLCQQRICQLPTSDPEQFKRQLIAASTRPETVPEVRSTRKTKGKND